MYDLPAERITEFRQANQELVEALTKHPDFAAQRQGRSGNVYFLWDFASKTDAILGSISSAPASRKEGLKSDALGRCLMLVIATTDTSVNPEMIFGEQPGPSADLGEEVRDKAKNFEDVFTQSKVTQPKAGWESHMLWFNS